MIPAFLIATALPILGGDVAVPLLKDSKNQPVFAALAGRSLYFSEGVAIDEPAGSCRGKDLYRVRLGEKKEERVAEYRCVIEVRAFGDAVYVVHRDEGETDRQVTKVRNDQIDEAFADAFAKTRANMAWKRITAGLPRRPTPELVGLAPSSRALWAVFHTAGEKPSLVAEAIVWTGDRAPATVALPAESAPPLELAVTGDGHWLALRARKGGVEVVRLKTDLESIIALGGEKPLPKDWKDAAAERWFARSPRFLTGTAKDVYVVDRTDQIFTEVSAVAAYTASTNRFRRVAEVPAADVGGLQWAQGGLLVAKPLAGHVIWYGPRALAPTGAVTASESAPSPQSNRPTGGKQ